MRKVPGNALKTGRLSMYVCLSWPTVYIIEFNIAFRIICTHSTKHYYMHTPSTCVYAHTSECHISLLVMMSSVLHLKVKWKVMKAKWGVKWMEAKCAVEENGRDNESTSSNQWISHAAFERVMNFKVRFVSHQWKQRILCNLISKMIASLIVQGRRVMTKNFISS